MPDIDKLYEKADKYLQRQKYEAAIETFQEILRYEPNNEECLVILGDLSLKLNRSADALRYQQQLADHYVKRNDNPKAIATFRRILKLTPRDAAAWMKLAGLLERSQKNSEALDAYREALGYCRKSSLGTQMLDCLNHIVKLDRNNLEEHLELAELASRLRQPQFAVPALLRAAQLARGAGDESRWEKLVEQAITVDPTDEIAAVAATELYLKRGDFADAAKLIEPVLANKPEDLEVLELACKSYLGSGSLAPAQPLCWKLYQAKPERIDLLLKLMDGMVQKGDVQQVLKMMHQLKDRLFQQGKRGEFLKVMEKVYEADESSLEVLEPLSNLYNELNNDDGLRRSLTRLFSLYLASENYNKAGDALERLLDVDPYGEGHFDRLLNLEGHIDTIWYQTISDRMQAPASGGRSSQLASDSDTTTEKPDSLEDLLVEGEMYHQYQLSAKLAETVEKIDRIYPGADEKNQRVRDLYEAAGYTPKFKAPAPAPGAAKGDASSPATATASLQSLEDLRKVPEITANVYRESTPQGVMQVAVNEVGRALNASRCWAAMGTPDRPPTLRAEYCSPLTGASDPTSALKLFTHLMAHATSSPDGWEIDNIAQSPLFEPIATEMQKLGIQALQALPLVDKDAPAGLLLIEQCDAPRAWSAGESLLLRAIATQVMIAVNNTKLRRLVRSLAGTDSETGLLPRSAYLECLLAEARRSKDQSQPLSVCLLEPENPHALLKALGGDAGVQRFVVQVGKTLIPTLRQNDISIRYSPLAVVVVFPDTALPQAGLAVEKVRKALAQVNANGSQGVNFCAAVCDVPLGPAFDAVDGVTEVINRLEVSLDHAQKEGGERVLISKFSG